MGGFFNQYNIKINIFLKYTSRERTISFFRDGVWFLTELFVGWKMQKTQQLNSLKRKHILLGLEL